METNQTQIDMTPLDRVIASLGSQSALATVIGVKQQTVSVWVKAGKPIPAEHVVKIETETGISRSDLRPDLFGVSEPAE